VSRCAGAVLAVLVAATGVVRAQGVTPDGPRQVLQTAKSLKCDFRLMATGTWGADGAPSGEVKTATLSLGFIDIDPENGIAEVEGSFGAPRIIVQLAGGYLHFMQVGLNGFLYTTTVFDKVSRPGRYKAVHTRHEYTEINLPGYTSRPQQYYGDCAIGR
jgi:hypothetical protein